MVADTNCFKDSGRGRHIPKKILYI